MQLSGVDVQNSMLQLFRDNGLAEGDELPLARLEQLWSQTALRRSDLLDGLVRLAAGGLIVLEDDDGDTRVLLTEAGATATRVLVDQRKASWNQYLKADLLPALRCRLTPEREGRGGRRSYELSSAVAGEVAWPRH